MTRVAAVAACLVGLAGALGAAGCDLLFPTRLSVGPVDATAHDGAGDGGSDAFVDVACDPAVPPGPPTAPASSTDASTSIYAVLRTISFVAPDGGTLGFDLDGVCTCPGPASCVSSNGAKACDGPGGRDTAGNALLTRLDGYLAAAGGDLNARIARGQMATILWVGADVGYDGLKNQALLGVTLLSSLGLDAPDGSAPKWDGTDTWTVDVSTVSAYSPLANGLYLYTPLPGTVSGYVTNGEVVAEDAGFKLGLGIGSLPIVGAVVTANLEAPAAPDAGPMHLTGQIAGRVPASAMLALASVLPDPASPGEHLCRGDGTAQAFASAVCAGADIAANPSLDNAGQPCDSLSFAFAFTAVAANLGAPTPEAYPAPACDGGAPSCP